MVTAAAGAVAGEIVSRRRSSRGSRPRLNAPEPEAAVACGAAGPALTVGLRRHHQRVAAEQDVPAKLVRAAIQVESAYNVGRPRRMG